MADFALKAFTFCGKFLYKKARTEVASRLTAGDLTETKFREMIIKPLDQINAKLDDLTQSKLKDSIDFFKRGMTVLHLRILEVNKNEMEKAALDKRLAELEKNLKLISETCKSSTPSEDDRKCFEKARKEFEKSADSSLTAMNYKTLAVSDRVTAARLNIIANILMNIDDVQLSLTHCKNVLKDKLNSIGEIGNCCKVQFRKGAAAAVRRRANNDERKELIQSVGNINRMVWDYACIYLQSDDSYFTDWPLINLVSERQLHPVLDCGIRELCGRREITTIDDFWPRSLSVTESRTFLVATKYGVQAILPNGLVDCVYPGRPRRVTKTPCDVRKRSDLAIKPLDDYIFSTKCAVSAHDKIFVSSNRTLARNKCDSDLPAAVYVYDSKGSFQYGLGYYIFTNKSYLTSMDINEYNELLVVDDNTNSLHAFSLYGAYLGKRASWENHDGYKYSYIAVSPDNRVFKTHGPDTIMIYDINHADRPPQQLVISEECLGPTGIAYDSTRHKLYVLVKLENGAVKVKIYVYDADYLTFEREITLKCRDWTSLFRAIAVTPSGFLAIIDQNELIVI